MPKYAARTVTEEQLSRAKTSGRPPLRFGGLLWIFAGAIAFWILVGAGLIFFFA